MPTNNSKTNNNTSAARQLRLSEVTEPLQQQHTTSNQKATAIHRSSGGTTLANQNKITGCNTGVDKKKKRNNKNRNRRGKGKEKLENTSAEITNSTGAEEDTTLKMKQKKVTRNRRRRENKRKNAEKYPWRALLPDPSAVDPITLEPLVQLVYPPFALAATEPYDVVKEWPLTRPTKKDESAQEREERLLKEQWQAVLPKEVQMVKEHDSSTPQHFNLYDGRALAYYMVSQLQFIDPLNRRDLRRDELVNLDAYLGRHGFSKTATVTEAYDAHGSTVSAAGSMAPTSMGRTVRLQEEAAHLLGALFGGRNTARVELPQGPSATTENTPRQQWQRSHSSGGGSSLAEQYNGFEDRHRLPTTQPNEASYPPSRFGEVNQVAMGAPGFLVVDAAAETYSGLPPSASWSASHMARGSNNCRPTREEFPSLSSVPVSFATPAPSPAPIATKGPTSKTLAKIGNMIKKTDPKEVQRQFEAREQARRKALYANMQLGVDPALLKQHWNDEQAAAAASVVPASAIPIVSEGQIERNRALAEALSIKPAPARCQINSGWARPTSDALRNELEVTTYPDSLIVQAREHMNLFLKLERKWKAFLADDKSPSLPLNHMERPMRRLVHEYSDYWRLHTESFDPEPRRYIHCVKLLDTRVPTPLISDVARQWRGPTRTPLPTSPASMRTENDHSLQQTAGQTTGRERSVLLPDDNDVRYTIEVSDAKTRPKLQLQKRTIPLELPPMKYTMNISNDIAKSQQRRKEQEQKERDREDRQRKILEAAFASDDEEDEGSIIGAGDDDSWEIEATPLYGDE